jgi:hypothetical protein
MTTKTDKPTATGIATPDTNNATKIDYEDGAWTRSNANQYWSDDYLYLRKGKHYKHLDQINQGLKNGPSWYNQRYINACANRNLTECISDFLELLPRQAQRATNYVLGQNLREWGVEKELVIWAVCAYVLHTDDRDQRRSYPTATKPTKGPEDRALQFWDFAYNYDFTVKQRLSTYHKVSKDMESPGPSKRGR